MPYNWSVDEKKFKKEDPKAYKIWRIQQMINYGLASGTALAEFYLKHRISEDLDFFYRLLNFNLIMLLWIKLIEQELKL